jgi:hypothetical protein
VDPDLGAFELVHDIAEGPEIGNLGRSESDIFISLLDIIFDFRAMNTVDDRNRIQASILQPLLVENIGIESLVAEVTVEIVDPVVSLPVVLQIIQISIEGDPFARKIR